MSREEIIKAAQEKQSYAEQLIITILKSSSL